MMSFTEKDLKGLEKLARIKCTKDEEVALLEKLKSTLAQIEMLDELDIGNVKPCCRVSSSHEEYTREDEVGEVIARDDLLSNAPDAVAGMVRVPPVMGDNA